MGAALIAINDNGTYTASIGYLNRSFTIDLPAFTARNESLPSPDDRGQLCRPGTD